MLYSLVLCRQLTPLQKRSIYPALIHKSLFVSRRTLADLFRLCYIIYLSLKPCFNDCAQVIFSYINVIIIHRKILIQEARETGTAGFERK